MNGFEFLLALSAAVAFPVKSSATFVVKHHVSFGDQVGVVGSFNNWNPCDALKCTWSEGDNWISERLPTILDGTYQWKAIVFGEASKTSCKAAKWQPGENNYFTATYRDQIVEKEIKISF